VNLAALLQRWFAEASARALRSPSYINLQALPQVIEGQLIADVVAALARSISSLEK